MNDDKLHAERITSLLLIDNRRLRHENKLLRAQITYWETRLLRETLPPLKENPDDIRPMLLRKQI